VKSESVILSAVKALDLAKDPEFSRLPGVLGVVLGFASHLIFGRQTDQTPFGIRYEGRSKSTFEESFGRACRLVL
jgi:hypothetical protein